MKNLIVSILFFLVPFVNPAQSSQVEKLFDKYSGQEGYTSVHITKYMFDMFAKIADEEEDKSFKEVTSNLTAIKIITVDNQYTNRTEDFYAEISRVISAPIYQDLMIVKDGSEEIKFLVKDANNTISELVMIVSEEGGGTMISLLGNINLKDISKLSKTMNIKGFEHLDKVED